MKQEIPWNRYAVESIVIVASILLAFAIDAWWDQRKETREEQVALQDLAEELRQNLTAIDNIWLDRHLRYFNSGVVVLRAIHGLPADHTSYQSEMLSKLRQETNWQETLDGFVASEVIGPILQQELLEHPVVIGTIDVEWAGRSATYAPSLASLDVLFQSGLIGRIQDSELRARLAELPSQLDDLISEENILFDYVSEEIWPELGPAIDGNLAVTLPRVPSSVLTEFAPLALEIIRDGVSVKPGKELAFVLSRRMGKDIRMLTQLELIIALYEEVLGLIDSY